MPPTIQPHELIRLYARIANQLRSSDPLVVVDGPEDTWSTVYKSETIEDGVDYEDLRNYVTMAMSEAIVTATVKGRPSGFPEAFTIRVPYRLGLMLLAVVLGTTLGMLLANVPVVLAGKAASAKIPFKAVRIAAAILFAGLGAYALFRARDHLDADAASAVVSDDAIDGWQVRDAVADRARAAGAGDVDRERRRAGFAD